MSTVVEVMCTLCGLSGIAETNPDCIGFSLSAMVWANHFDEKHPGTRADVAEYVVMVEK